MKKTSDFFIYFGLLFGGLLFVGLTAVMGPVSTQAAELVLPLNYAVCAPDQTIYWSWEPGDDAVRVYAHKYVSGIKTTFCDSGSVSSGTSHACMNWPNTTHVWVDYHEHYH